MGSAERDSELTPADLVLGAAYFVLHQLPADPDKAAPLLLMIGEALADPKPRRIEGWTREASYVLTHLRKRDGLTASRILAVAAGIIENVRPRYTELARSI